jgi:hypothetical protein
MNTDLLGHLPMLLVLLASFTAPVAAGFWLEIGWLTRMGFFWLFMFLLALYGATWQRLQRQREVKENMRRILEQREQQRDKEK